MSHFAVGSRQVCKSVTNKALSSLTPQPGSAMPETVLLQEGGVAEAPHADPLATKLVDRTMAAQPSANRDALHAHVPWTLHVAQ
jgi:hypothetical protein